MDDTQEESLFEAPPIAEQERMVEAILFAAAEPVSVREMAGRMPHGCDPLQWCRTSKSAMRVAVLPL